MTASTVESAELTRTARRKALTRGQLLEAAAEVMAEAGFYDAKVQDIAARADVGTGTVYNYFRSKDEIFEALVADTIADLAAHLDDVREDHEAGESRLRAGWHALLEFADMHRAQFRALFGVGRGFHTFMQRVYETFADTAENDLRAMIADGQIRPCHTGLLAAGTVGMASQVISWWLDHPEVGIAEVVDEMATFEWQGLQANAGTPPQRDVQGD